MTIKQQLDKYWLVDMYPFGRDGQRIRKRFTTKAEAERFESYIKLKAKNEGWITINNDDERLNDLIETWFNLHGQALSDGKKRQNKLFAMSKMMGNPAAKVFDKNHFSAYRKIRLEIVSIKTVNNEQTYVNALFNELIRLGEWDGVNPIAGMRALKYKTPEMGYLQPAQIQLLLVELNNSRNENVTIIAKICLSTGCRWGEAEALRSEHISNNKITFVNTKGNKPRTVPISPDLSAELPKTRGRLFGSSLKAFREAMERTGIVLPSGQMSHVLRHTFASHFMTNGGNILVLQRILGHASIVDTMKYSHFAPEHLEDAVRLNPLSHNETKNQTASN
jgi:integrase